MSKYNLTELPIPFQTPISKMAMGLRLVVEHNTEMEIELRATRNLCLDLYEELGLLIKSLNQDEEEYFMYQELRKQMIELELIGEHDA